MRLSLAIVLSMSLLLTVCRADEQLPLKDQKARDSYSLGYEFGDNLRRQEVGMDVDILLSSIREGLEAKKPVLSPEDIHETLQQLRRKAIVLQDRRYRERVVKNLEEGKVFLAANKTKEGVQTLPSGLQYTVLREGEGLTPKASDTATVNYRGTLVNGTEFDSSYSRGEPATVNIAGVMPGWTEALQLMKVGSKWQIFVPLELAYGERQYGRIPPNSALIFEIELISFKEKPVAETTESGEEGSDAGSSENKDK